MSQWGRYNPNAKMAFLMTKHGKGMKELKLLEPKYNDWFKGHYGLVVKFIIVTFSHRNKNI